MPSDLKLILPNVEKTVKQEGFSKGPDDWLFPD